MFEIRTPYVVKFAGVGPRVYVGVPLTLSRKGAVARRARATLATRTAREAKIRAAMEADRARMAESRAAATEADAAHRIGETEALMAELLDKMPQMGALHQMKCPPTHLSVTDALKHAGFDTIAAQCAGMSGRGSLSKNQHIAIVAYTMQTSLYGTLNSALRQRTASGPGPDFPKWQPYTWHLVQALGALPDHAGTVYRGMYISGGFDPQDYTKSTKIHWSAFNSASTNPGVATGFSVGGVVFIIDVQNAKDIQPFSAFPTENEVLLSPNMEFIVTKELHCGPHGAQTIKMQQIPNATIWS